jgi:hypothetical protein
MAQESSRVFRLTVVTSPGEGKFWDYASVSLDDKHRNTTRIDFFSTFFTRVNAYGPQTKCATDFHRNYQPYFYCRNQTEEAKAADGGAGNKGW